MTSWSITLQTAKGRVVRNEQRCPWSKTDQPTRDRLDESKALRFPNAKRRRAATEKYNCHGMSFANRRTGIWSSDPIPMILEDDGFRAIAASQVHVGDLVVYYYLGALFWHTGIVVDVPKIDSPEAEKRMTVMSKWGELGEYIHSVGDDPYLGDSNDSPFISVSYYTERP